MGIPTTLERPQKQLSNMQTIKKVIDWSRGTLFQVFHRELMQRRAVLTARMDVLA